MTGAPELEELPPQRVLPRRSGRPGAPAIVGISATAILLAGGLGLLGGRPAPSPTPTWATDPTGAASSLTGAAPTGADREPAVTPAVPCGPNPPLPPDVLFEVDGRVYRSDPGGAVAEEAGSPINIPREATTVLWIDGGACAVAWRIEVGGNGLETQDNAAMSPRVASQNRFRFLLPDAAGPQILVANLGFESYSLELGWLIQVDPFDAPDAELALASKLEMLANAVPGCDLTIRLENGYANGPSDCGGSGIGPVSDNLEPLRAQRSEPLVFRLLGWRLGEVDVQCGHLASDPLNNGNSIFIPAPACALVPHLVTGGITFDAPAAPGPWAIAVHTCATTLPGGGGDSFPICGAWYAKVEVG